MVGQDLQRDAAPSRAVDMKGRDEGKCFSIPGLIFQIPAFKIGAVLSGTMIVLHCDELPLFGDGDMVSFLVCPRRWELLHTTESLPTENICVSGGEAYIVRPAWAKSNG